MPETSTALVGFKPMAPTVQGRKEMGEFFSSADVRVWNALPPASKIAFSNVALALGLHPLAGEIMVYKDKLYITIDGRRRLAYRQDDFAAVQPEIVSDPTIRRAMGARWAGDILARCRLYRKSTPIPTIQYGLVREAERYPSDREREALGIKGPDILQARAAHDPDLIMDAATNPEAKVRPVITQPAIMAMKRAEARCLNIIAQAPLPTFDVELGAPLDEDAPNGEPHVVEIHEVPAQEVEGEPLEDSLGEAGWAEAQAAAEIELKPGENPLTITDKTATVDPKPTPAPAPSVPRPAAPQSDPVKGRGGVLNPPETPAKLVQFAIQKLGFKNTAAILNALNVGGLDEIVDPQAAWIILCDLQGK